MGPPACAAASHQFLGLLDGETSWRPEIQAASAGILRACQSHFCALRRRGWLRSLDENSRRRVALETKDPLLRDAVIHAPAKLSGLQPNIKQTVIENIVQDTSWSQLVALNSLGDGLENVQAAIAVAETLRSRRQREEVNHWATFRPRKHSI